MKRGIILLMVLSLVPAVLAQEQGIFSSAFSLIFGPVSGGAGNDIVLKIGLWLALIFIFFQGAQKIFKHKDQSGQDVPAKKIAITFSIIIATIAVRFMPPSVAGGLGTITWIAALILLPYTLISFVTDNTWAKVIGTGVTVLFTWGLLSSYGAPYVFPFIRGSEFFSDLYYLLTPQSYLLPIIAAGVLLILILIFFAGKGSSDGAGGSSNGGGFFDWLARRREAKAAVKQAKLQAKAAVKQAKLQAKSASQGNKAQVQAAKAALKQAKLQAKAAKAQKPGFWERRRQAKAARQQVKPEVGKSPQVKKLGFWERRRQAKAARQQKAVQPSGPGRFRRGVDWLGNKFRRQPKAKPMQAEPLPQPFASVKPGSAKERKEFERLQEQMRAGGHPLPQPFAPVKPGSAKERKEFERLQEQVRAGEHPRMDSVKQASWWERRRFAKLQKKMKQEGTARFEEPIPLVRRKLPLRQRSPEKVAAKIREHESKLATSRNPKEAARRRAALESYRKMQKR